MPSYDDIDENKTDNNKDSPKEVQVTKSGKSTIYKASNFRGFFNALKGTVGG